MYKPTEDLFQQQFVQKYTYFTNTGLDGLQTSPQGYVSRKCSNAVI